MQSKIVSKHSLTIIVVAFFLITILLLTLSFSGQISYAKISPIMGQNTKTLITGTSVKFIQNISSKKKITPGLPVSLKISKIKVNAPIKSLGLAADGSMEVTKGPYDVAWFNLGPRPGEKGSAVIAGHYGTWKNGAISIFNKLHTLVKGDKISVVDDKGTIISFIVRESKIYPLNANASEVFYSNDGKSHLNLITCIQDKVTKKYPNRLVVFTDREILTWSK